MRQYSFNSSVPGSGFRIGPGLLSPFIKWMLIANAAVFLLEFFIGDHMIQMFGLTPARFYSDFPNLLYQVVTYMFLHAGFWHIFFNLFALWMFGTEIELTWGSKTFGWFYLVAGLCGAILTLIVTPHQAVPMIGASGAIYGILVAYWLMFPNRLLYLWFLFPIKVKWAIPGFMILGFLFSGGGVAHLAHLGGALYGLAYLKLDWRLFTFKDRLKNLRYKRQEAKLQKNRQKAEDVMKRVDEILDKINEVGIENLTREERRFLEDASSEMSRDGQHRSSENR